MWALSLGQSLIISLLAWVFAGKCWVGLRLWILNNSSIYRILQVSGKPWPFSHLRLNFCFGQNSTHMYLFFSFSFYVSESVMLSILWLCQISNAYSHIFWSNGHLTWAFHQKTRNFWALGQLTRKLIMDLTYDIAQNGSLGYSWSVASLKNGSYLTKKTKQNSIFMCTHTGKCDQKEIIWLCIQPHLNTKACRSLIIQGATN